MHKNSKKYLIYSTFHNFSQLKDEEKNERGCYEFFNIYKNKILPMQFQANDLSNLKSQMTHYSLPFA